MDYAYRPCEIHECSEKLVPWRTGCGYCHRYMCDTHIAMLEHDCFAKQGTEGEARWKASRERHLSAFYDRTKHIDLAKLAEDLRPGHKCTLVPPTSLDDDGLNAGSHHIHIQLDFDDGVKWWARIKQEGFEKPRYAMAKIMTDGEVATLKFLHGAGVKVPRVWTTEGETNGFNLCFVEHVPGVPWRQVYEAHRPTDETTMRDYAKFMIGVSLVPIRGVGSIESVDPIAIGGVRSFVYHKSDAPYFLGPHKSLGAHYLAWLDRDMQNILELPNTVHQPVSKYLHALHLKEMILNDPELSDENCPTYLVHADTRSGDIIRTDEGGQITGVIDWEFTMTVPKAAAFSAPYFCLDLDMYYDGRNELANHELMLAKAYDDLGRPDLGDCVRKGKKYQRLEDMRSTSWPMWSALIECFTGQRPEETTEEEWESMAKVEYAEDEGLKRVMAQEEKRVAEEEAEKKRKALEEKK